VAIGGPFGSNVQEQVVDVTNFAIAGVPEVSDERHPFWTADEQSLYYSSNRGGGNYQLWTVGANPSPDPAASGSGAVAITREPGAIHDFPVLNPAGNRIAYIKSTDGGATFQLYQALVPTAGTTITPQATTDSLTVGRNVGGDAITTVGRPSWLSGTEIVFAATFASGATDVVVVDIQSFLMRKLVTGTATESNVTVSPDGNFIAFDSDATGYTGNAANGTTGSGRNIFVINSAGTIVTQITNADDGNGTTPPVADTTVSSVQPAWSRSNVTPIFNTSTTYYIAFASDRQPNPAFDPTTPSSTTPAYIKTPNGTKDIYYVPAVSVDSGTQVRTTTPETNSSNALKVDTRDTNFQWNDEYPSWPPLINLQRLAFQSNRKGSSATSFVPHNPVDQHDLFIATLIDITAPTLLRYDLSSDTGEVVHINMGTTFTSGASVRNRSDGITPGTKLFFTVRAEDLESGVKSVYIQFKNPNSKYQAAKQGGTATEHKEYMLEALYPSFSQSLNSSDGVFLGSFIRYEAFNGGFFPFLMQPRNVDARTFRPDFQGITNPQNLGQEYEAEVVSAASSQQFGTSSYFQHNLNRQVKKFAANLGVRGLYDAAKDDVAAFSGSNHPAPVDPAVNPDPANPDANGIWLKLKPLPDSQQDNNGGKLYGATWTIPADDASDWYMDVILYDNAVNPFDPNGSQSNWIIYDNVWGFSSALGLNSDPVDLLFVSDYALGQKFAITRFGDPNASAGLGASPNYNLPNQEFGAESYYTDRDLSDALDGSFAPDAPWSPTPPTNNRIWDPAPGRQSFSGGPFLDYIGIVNRPSGVQFLGTPNPLGFGSYVDSFLSADSTSVTEAAVSGQRVTGFQASVGRYSIWRILSRGPVPSNVLTDYLPAPGTRPPDTRTDPATVGTAGGAKPYETGAQNVSIINRAVIWAAPFALTSFRGTGAISDLQTQTDLRGYVQSGGRLFISGQDVAFALGNGNSFLTDVLGAQLIASSTGTITGVSLAAGAASRIQQITTDAFLPSPQTHVYSESTATVPTYNPPSTGPLELMNIPGLNPPGGWRGDASFLAPTNVGGPNYLGFIDQITTSGANSKSIYTYNGLTTSAMVFNQFGTGEVVFAAFGFESLSNGWYAYTPQGSQDPIQANHGRRAEIMHNITCSFRTGFISGRILDDNGSPVSNALIIANTNPNALATSKALGTALTDANGNYTIQGLLPGTYYLEADRAGYYRQSSTGNTFHGGSHASVNLTLKRANPGRLADVQYLVNDPRKPNRPKLPDGRPQGGVFRSDDKTGIGGVPILAYRTETTATGVTFTGYLTHTSKGDANNPEDINASGRLLQVGEYAFKTQIPVGFYTVIANPKALTTNGQPLVGDGSNSAVTVQDSTGKPVTDPGNLSIFETVMLTSATQTNIDLQADDPATTQSEATIIVNGQVQIQSDLTSGIDFRLKSGEQAITGDVRQQNDDGSAGAGIAGALVQATLQGSTTVLGTGTTDSNGHFALTYNNQTPATADDRATFPEGTYTISVATANGYDLTTTTSTRPSVDALVGGDSAIAVQIVEPRDPAQPLVKPGALILKKLPPGSVSGLVTRVPGSIPVVGATVNLYAADGAGNRLDGDNNATNGITPLYTTQTVVVQTDSTGYQFNYGISAVATGTYVADVNLKGYSPNPTLSAVFTVTSATETKNINFSLEAPKIYGGGVQLISIPLDYTKTSAATDPHLIFGLRNGGDNNGDGTVNGNDQALFTAFNIAEWTGDLPYNISPTIPLVRGKGFFVNFGGATAVTDSDAVGATGDEFTIDLAPGWNLIGHPFARLDNPYALPASIDLATGSLYKGIGDADFITFASAVAKGYIQSVALGYTGSNSNSQYFEATTLQPWLGYWFNNTSNQHIQMKLLRPSESASASSIVVGGTRKVVTRAEMEKVHFRSIESKNVADWRLQVAARQDNLLDTDNSVGVSAGAKEGYDNQYDTLKPPAMTQAPQLYVAITNKDRNGRAVPFADDIRDGTQTGVTLRSWSFTVQPAAGKGDVTIFWPNVNRLPRGIEPFLVDVASGKRVPMRSGASSYTFTPKGDEVTGRAVHTFRIEVAKPSSLPLMLMNVRQTRIASRGVGNPGGYRFSFTVSRAAGVIAEIKTLTGQTVSHLTTRAEASTESSIFWDGKAQDGTLLPAGAYVLTISATDTNGSVTQVQRPIMNLR